MLLGSRRRRASSQCFVVNCYGARTSGRSPWGGDTARRRFIGGCRFFHNVATERLLTCGTRPDFGAGADNHATAYAPWIGLDASKLQEISVAQTWTSGL